MRPNKILMTVCIALLCALLMAGCSGSKRNNSLKSTLIAYANAIRWGDIEVALRYLEPEARTKITRLELERWAHVKISRYTEKEAAPAPTGDGISQLVEIGVTNKHTLVEHTVLDRQHWRWDETVERWWLTSGLPELTNRE